MGYLEVGVVSGKDPDCGLGTRGVLSTFAEYTKDGGPLSCAGPKMRTIPQLSLITPGMRSLAGGDDFASRIGDIRRTDCDDESGWVVQADRHSLRTMMVRVREPFQR